MLKKANKKRGKKGLSEIVAYSILIAIAIGLAVAVYGVLQYIAKSAAPVADCNDGTSVYLDSYNCTSIPTGGTYFTLNIKNNGRFNISGVIVKVGDDLSKDPVIMLNNSDPLNHGYALGNYYFSDIGGLDPGVTEAATFINSTTNGVSQIRRVSIQPYIFNENRKKVLCTGTLFKEPIIGNGC